LQRRRTGSLELTTVPATWNFLVQKVKKQKPRIPEPSPRLVFWSMVVGGLLIMAAVGYDYVTGSRDFATPAAAQASDGR
jgi:hypothetical protein